MNYSKKIISPFGSLFLIASETALISLDNVSSELYKKSSYSSDHEIFNITEKQLNQYFQGLRKIFDIPIKTQGTPFQTKVWESLGNIPFGKVWSYGHQAKFLKAPKASRAVGGANGKNPIPIIIPCHRVIGSTGKLTGYSGGIKMKIWLLEHEGHSLSADKKLLLI